MNRPGNPDGTREGPRGKALGRNTREATRDIGSNKLLDSLLLMQVHSLNQLNQRWPLSIPCGRAALFYYSFDCGLYHSYGAIVSRSVASGSENTE